MHSFHLKKSWNLRNILHFSNACSVSLLSDILSLYSRPSREMTTLQKSIYYLKFTLLKLMNDFNGIHLLSWLVWLWSSRIIRDNATKIFIEQWHCCLSEHRQSNREMTSRTCTRQRHDWGDRSQRSQTESTRAHLKRQRRNNAEPHRKFEFSPRETCETWAAREREQERTRGVQRIPPCAM